MERKPDFSPGASNRNPALPTLSPVAMIHTCSSMGTAKHRAVKRGGGKTRCRKGARVAVHHVNRDGEHRGRVRAAHARPMYGSVRELMLAR